jgi:hypothetical protein
MGVDSQGMRLFAYVKDVDKAQHFKEHIHFLIGGTFCFALFTLFDFNTYPTIFDIPKHLGFYSIMLIVS